MSDNPTSDEIDESNDEKLEQDADKAADALDETGYGGPGPENETGEKQDGS